MNGSFDMLEDIRAALSPHGISLRGVFRFEDDQTAPVLTTVRRRKASCCSANRRVALGPFSRWRSRPEHAVIADPLDKWSKAVIRPLAERLGATAYFPSDPPCQPFQQWAMRAEGLKPSPLGILIHPEYGLWHGYRGGLGFKLPIDDEASSVASVHPCDHCAEKPCLTRCRPNAISLSGFDVGACRAHLRTDEGKKTCLAGGCLAREACPVGIDYRYPPGQLAFHMAALSP